MKKTLPLAGRFLAKNLKLAAAFLSLLILLSFNNKVRAQSMYYLAGDNSDAFRSGDRITKVNQDGTGLIKICYSVSAPQDMVLDIPNNRAFVSSFTTRTVSSVSVTDNGIYKIDLTSGAATLLVSTNNNFRATKLAYDPVNDYLYYTSNDGNDATTVATDRISRIKGDGTGNTVLASSISPLPTFLGIDIPNNKIYIYESAVTAPKFMTYNLSGNSATLGSSFVMPRINGMDYDPISNWVYYTTDDGTKALTTDDALWKMRPDGTSQTKIISSFIPNPGIVTVDRTRNIAFVWNSTEYDRRIVKVDIARGTQSAIPISPEFDVLNQVFAIAIPAVSNVATLSAFTINSGTLTPGFSSGTTTYTASVASNVSSITVKPIKTDNFASITVNGNKIISGYASGNLALNIGDNVISTVVTTEDGLTTKTYTVTITRAKTPQTINFAATALKTYGAADFDPGASAGSTLPVTYTSNNTAVATIVNNKVHVVGVGNATITAAQGGNTIYSAAPNLSQMLTVKKALLTLTADPLARKYGSANPAFTGTVSGFMLNDTKETATTGIMAFTCSATSQSNVGVYPIIGGGLSAANYDIIQAPANYTALSITQVDVIYTAKSITITYGKTSLANSSIEITYDGFVNNQKISQASYRVQVLSNAFFNFRDAGSYYVTILAEQTANNYIFVPAASNETAITIRKAKLYYVANPASKKYGEANPTFTGTLTGFVLGQTEKSATSGISTFTTNASATSGAGTYDITGSGKSAFNYEIVQSPNNADAFTINKNTLTYTATPVSRAFNTTTATPITGTVTGFVNGDTQESATTGTSAFATAVDVTTGVGSYPITGLGLSASDYDIVQSDANATAYSIYLATNGNLSSMAISQGTLSPAFSSGTNSYKTTIANAVTSLTVTPGLSDVNARVTVNGAQIPSGTASAAVPLTAGENTIHVNVTAQDGTTTNPYVIVVTRLPSSDASFASFAVTGAAVTEDLNNPGRITGNVAKDVTSVNVTASVLEPNATLLINGVETPSGTTITLPLIKGENVYGVQVKAQDGVTYQSKVLSITRAFSATNTLASLTPSEGVLTPAFSPSVNDYTLAVGNATKTVDFTPVLTDELSYVNQDGLPAQPTFTKNAAVGDNPLEIFVQAENGTQNVYKVNIQREASHDASLTSLGITTATDAIEPFDLATYNYNTSVAYNVDALRLNPVATNEGATIKINGIPVTNSGGINYFQYFTVPETTTIEVTAGDGTTAKTYTITATRKASDNNLLANLQINDGAVTLSPEFDPAVETYNAVISDPTVSNVLIKPTKGEDHQEIRVNFGAALNVGGSQYIELNSGANQVGVRVLSQNFTEKNYTIKIIRPLSANADLSYVTLSGGQAGEGGGDGGGGSYSHNFNLAYDSLAVSVPNSVAVLKIFPGPEDAGASATVNGYVVPKDDATDNLPLDIGDNAFVISITSADGTTTKNHTLHVTRLPDADVNLASLTINKGIVNAPFSPDLTSYNVKVAANEEYVTITPVAHAAGVSVTVNNVVIDSANPGFTNPYPLNNFSNIFRVTVTAADRINKKTYMLKVTRQQAYDATLGNIVLSIGSISPVFNANTTDYTAEVHNAVSTINLTPQSPDANANITVTGGGATTTINGSTPFATVPLNVGDNVVTTTMTSQDGQSTQTYTVVITREPSADATLASLNIDNGSMSPAFNTDVMAYTASENLGIDNIKVYANPTDIHAIVKVNGIIATPSTGVQVPLILGNNVINVVVTAQDGSTINRYTLTVNRAASANAVLSGIILNPASKLVSTGTPYNYTMNVVNTTTAVTLTATAQESHATIKVNGVATTSGSPSQSITLTGTNTPATIEVTAEDGTTKVTYHIGIVKVGSNNALLSSIALNPNSKLVSTGTPYSYTMSVVNTTTAVNLIPTVQESHATVKVNGVAVTSGSASQSISLTGNSTPATIVVTAEDGTTTQSYQVAIVKVGSNNALLSGITMDPGSVLTPAGAPFTYNTTVPTGTTTVTLNPAVQESHATVTVNGVTTASGTPSQGITLTGTSTQATIVVTAEDGIATQTYTVNIIKTTGSNNAVLSSITLNPGSRLISTGTPYSYTMNVINTTTVVNLIPTAQESHASIKVNGVAVTSGTQSQAITLTGTGTPNTIVVTAEDGVTTQTYKVAVIRVGSGNAQLSQIALNPASKLISTGTPYSYTMSVVNTTTAVNLVPTAQESHATIKVNGITTPSGTASQSITLTGASTPISIVVTAEDGTTTQSYQVAIVKVGSNNALLSGIKLNPGSQLIYVSPYNYTMSVPNGTTTATLTAFVQESHATLKINGSSTAAGSPSQTIALAGTNTPNAIVVTAEDGVTMLTYNVTIVKAAGAISSIVNNTNDNKILKENNQGLTDPATTTLAINVHQAVSPNGDGINDALTIEGIEQYPENKVLVMNRSGEVIFTTTGYNNSSTTFDGHGSNGKLQQPGTYFYSLEYKQGNTTQRKTGYIVLKY